MKSLISNLTNHKTEQRQATEYHANDRTTQIILIKGLDVKMIFKYIFFNTFRRKIAK